MGQPLNKLETVALILSLGSVSTRQMPQLIRLWPASMNIRSTKVRGLLGVTMVGLCPFKAMDIARTKPPLGKSLGKCISDPVQGLAPVRFPKP